MSILSNALEKFIFTAHKLMIANHFGFLAFCFTFCPPVCFCPPEKHACS